MDISSIARLTGPNLMLRLITPADAAYVHHLRTNPAYNSHLSTVTGNVADQRQWIETYKSREASGQELYYVIERHDSTRCGLVRLYDITPSSFTWGSWILDVNKPHKAALESAMLSFGIGFDVLHASLANVDVKVENIHATAFYRRLGMTETNRTAQDIFFVYPRERFEADRVRHIKAIEVQ